MSVQVFVTLPNGLSVLCRQEKHKRWGIVFRCGKCLRGIVAWSDEGFMHVQSCPVCHLRCEVLMSPKAEQMRLGL
ncbi:MAG: hypothetical protein JO356_02780 [Acidobacteria bacterium]|nr:hypothetical protein [Acidobacteriota bacterium]